MKKDIYFSSRICYIVEATAEYLISLLIAGTYLAKLTAEMGFSDSLTAVLSSFVALGCSFQLLTLVFFKSGRVKRRVAILHTLNQLLFMLLYMTPFFPFPPTVKAVLFILFLFSGQCIANIINTPKINWFMSLVPDGQRGVFTALKEAASLIAGILFQFIMGTVMDRFEAAGNMRAAFTVCGLTIFGLTLIHTLSMILAKEKEPVESKAPSLRQTFRETLLSPKIRRVILIAVFWSVCTHVSVSFFATYQVKELGFSMTFIAFLSFLYTAVRIPASFFLGRYADRRTFANMLKICFGITAAAFLLMVFVVPANGRILYPVYYVLYAAAMGGINSAQINLVFDIVPLEKRRDTLAIKQSVSGVIGFLTTLAVAPAVSFIQKAEPVLFGKSVYAQQILAAGSAVISVCLILYVGRTASPGSSPQRRASARRQ